jgi:adenine/guanine/hypoxanthine permease
VTPSVALAYAVVAAGFLAVGRLGTSSDELSHPEIRLAAPAE